MTGIFVRVQRDGKWQNLELESLTDEELDKFISTQGADGGWSWVKVLVKWIRDNVKEQECP